MNKMTGENLPLLISAQLFGRIPRPLRYDSPPARRLHLAYWRTVERSVRSPRALRANFVRRDDYR